ncbi:MAG: hypothetical protein R3D98_15855 [Candidatus Krumholzibacteriia bacterium]
MNDPRPDRHLDLAELEAFVADERPDLKRHVDRCPGCRAKARDLARFLSLDADADLQRDADWPGAEARLERLGPPRPRRAREVRRWWPVAAALAAVLTLVLVNLPRDLADPSGRTVVRGAGAAAAITLIAPLDDLAACPDRFTWSCEPVGRRYSVEVFTAELARVAGVDSLPSATWATVAALCDSLVPGRRYLWTVTAHFDVREPVTSAPGWFRIAP